MYVDNFDLVINSDTTTASLKSLSINNISGEVKSVFIKGIQNMGKLWRNSVFVLEMSTNLTKEIHIIEWTG